ncbi:MAG: hypothetical protein L0H07_13855, partial [Corynebacterium sp.]|nr:hypothetical protein [Corynebacterium sp.]
MSNPSDPHRHHGDDLPRDTDAFEDTEFTMGGDAAGSGSSDGTDGFAAEIDDSGARDDSDENTEVIDAESAEVTDDTGDAGEAEAPLGSTNDPEVTGIIPVVDDEQISGHELKHAPGGDAGPNAGPSTDAGSDEDSATSVLPLAGVAGAAGAAGAAGSAGAASASTGTSGEASADAPTTSSAASTGTGESAASGSAAAASGTGTGSSSGGSGSGDGTSTKNSSRPWYGRFPTWGWILVIGGVLSVGGAATAVAMMNSGSDQERQSPYSSVEPN